MNRQIQLTKIFTFEMAHALLDYDGDCRNIHGHSYQLHVTVAGQPLEQKGHPKNGMVIDFKVLKALVKCTVIKGRFFEFYC
ncbi:MAG: 6-carboxytetrahydropterin synthase [Bacteroidota bacterium]